MNPFIFSELWLEYALHEPLHTQSESRTQLLQTRTRFAIHFLVNVPVVANKDKVTLVMKCDYLASF